MKLEKVIRGISITDRRGCFEVDVAGVTADSRTVREGDVYVAVRGHSQDGHAFITPALKQGAAAVIAEEWPESLDEGLDRRPNVVLVPNTRRALALAAANMYGQPSRSMVMAGVTGTNGKTTVTYVLESILLAAGKKVGLIGTTGSRFDGTMRTGTHTTPDAVALQRTLGEMLAAGVSHVVTEVSSHALDQQRVAGVHFKVAGFTNLTQDHLDYHKSIEAYFEAKSLLFSDVLKRSHARGRMAVVNVDDPKGEAMIEAWGGKSLRVSAAGNEEADLWVREADFRLDGTTALVETSKGPFRLQTSLLGRHNLTNLLVAVGMAQAMGFSESRIQAGLERLDPIPGRLEPVPAEDGRKVFVDYAHTPDALAQVLAAMRTLTKGRLIVVFGCGGNRDAQKRPAMGKAVAEHADLAVLTSDNPRDEDPAEIAKAVEAGLLDAGWSRIASTPAPRTFQTELDRRQAIQTALDWANEEDVVVIAGKGHETEQVVQGQASPFDDREEARRILAGLPPPAVPPPPPPPPAEVDGEQVVDSVDIEPDIVGEAEDGPPTEEEPQP